MDLNRKKAVIFLVLSVLVIIIGVLYYFDFVQRENINKENPQQAMYKKMIYQMFPASEYQYESPNTFVFDDKFSIKYKLGYHKYYVQDIKYGRYTEKKDQILIILRAPDDVLCHSCGFYNVIAAVFDAETLELKSPVKQFMTDEGDFGFFDGNGKTYIMFSGISTYTGHSTASEDSGLYEVFEGEWHKVWPENNKFWEGNCAVIGMNRIYIYKFDIDTWEKEERQVAPFGYQLVKELVWYGFEFVERRNIE